MARLHLVSLLLCALLPLPGLAQAPSPPPLIPAPAAREEAPPAPGEEKARDELIPRSPKEPESGGWRAGRVVLESLGGLVLGLVGTAPAIVVAIPNFSCSTCGQEESLVAAQLLGLAGVSLVGALGVKLAGSLMGGEGRYLGALQGAGIASGASIFVMLALENSPGAFALPMVLFPVLGAVIGYEMSHGAELERQAKGGPAVALFPAVDVSPAGGVVAGLVGSF